MLVEKNKAYMLHTPLGIWVGLVVEIDLDQVMLNQCSWIPDQGRMSECYRDGSYKECEPVGDGVVIPHGFIAVPWRHPLPDKVK